MTFTPTCSFVFDAMVSSRGPVHVVLVPGGSVDGQFPIVVDVEVPLIGGIVKLPIIQPLFPHEICQFLLFPILQVVRMTKINVEQ